MDTSRLKRQIYPMPDYVAKVLDEEKLFGNYHARPPYQQNDYISWITRAKQEVTRQKRLKQMLDELRVGDAYMGMSYQTKIREEK